MTAKPITPRGNFSPPTMKQANLALALGLPAYLVGYTIQCWLGVDFNFWQWEIPAPTTFLANALLKWWLPSAALFILFRHTIYSWLGVNTLAHIAFLLSNVTIFTYPVTLTFYYLVSGGNVAYFLQRYFQIPWLIFLSIGLASLVAATAWSHWFSRNEKIRHLLHRLLSTEHTKEIR